MVSVISLKQELGLHIDGNNNDMSQYTLNGEGKNLLTDVVKLVAAASLKKCKSWKRISGSTRPKAPQKLDEPLLNSHKNNCSDEFTELQISPAPNTVIASKSLISDENYAWLRSTIETILKKVLGDLYDVNYLNQYIRYIIHQVKHFLNQGAIWNPIEESKVRFYSLFFFSLK